MIPRLNKEAYLKIDHFEHELGLRAILFLMTSLTTCRALAFELTFTCLGLLL